MYRLGIFYRSTRHLRSRPHRSSTQHSFIISCMHSSVRPSIWSNQENIGFISSPGSMIRGCIESRSTHTSYLPGLRKFFTNCLHLTMLPLRLRASMLDNDKQLLGYATSSTSTILLDLQFQCYPISFSSSNHTRMSPRCTNACQHETIPARSRLSYMWCACWRVCNGHRELLDIASWNRRSGSLSGNDWSELFLRRSV